MKGFFLSALIAMCVVVSVLGESPNLVLVITRHGARAPLDTRFDKTWGNQYSQLTKTGMRQQYLLGAALAAKYRDVLGNYTPSSIYLRAHSQNRTLQSMYSQAQGLFSALPGPLLPNGSAALDNQLQPYPVHSMNGTQDPILYTHKEEICPIVTTLRRNETEDGPKKIMQMINATVAKLSEAFGREISLTDVGKIFDTLRCDYFENKSFPANLSWIQYGDKYWNDIAFAHDWWFMYKDYATLQQRGLFSTNLLHEITAKFNNFLTQKSAPRFLSYLGHDTTLAPILGLFNVTTHDCIVSVYQNGQASNPACYAPVFASSLRFELYKKANASDSYLKIFYDDNEINLCQNNTGPCTVAAFSQAVENLTNGTNMTGYYQQCYSLLATRVEEGRGLKIALWILMGVNAVLLVILIVRLVYKKKFQTSETFDKYYKAEKDASVANY